MAENLGHLPVSFPDLSWKPIETRFFTTLADAGWKVDEYSKHRLIKEDFLGCILVPELPHLYRVIHRHNKEGHLHFDRIYFDPSPQFLILECTQPEAHVHPRIVIARRKFVNV